LVIPILSAAASMMLVLFGLALLLNSPSGGMTTQTIAMATLTAESGSASASDRIQTTPTLAPTLAITEVEVAEIMQATDEEIISAFGTDPETGTGGSDNASVEEMADVAPLDEAQEDTDDQEADGSVMRFTEPLATEEEAGGGIFDLLAPTGTLELLEEEASAPGAANSEIAIPSTDLPLYVVPPAAMATNALPSPLGSPADRKST